MPSDKYSSADQVLRMVLAHFDKDGYRLCSEEFLCLVIQEARGALAALPETGTFNQDALDRASWELQRHFGREGSIYGIKACEEIARIALVAYGALSATGASIPYRATIKFDHETREVRGTLDLPVDTTVHKEKP